MKEQEYDAHEIVLLGIGIPLATILFIFLAYNFIGYIAWIVGDPFNYFG